MGLYGKEFWSAEMDAALVNEKVNSAFSQTFNKDDRGEQPDSLALPADGALRGDVPLSGTERSEV